MDIQRHRSSDGQAFPPVVKAVLRTIAVAIALALALAAPGPGAVAETAERLAAADRLLAAQNMQNDIADGLADVLAGLPPEAAKSAEVRKVIESALMELLKINRDTTARHLSVEEMTKMAEMFEHPLMKSMLAKVAAGQKDQVTEEERVAYRSVNADPLVKAATEKLETVVEPEYRQQASQLVGKLQADLVGAMKKTKK